MARIFDPKDVEITVTPEEEHISPDGQFDTGDGEADLEIINAIKKASEWSEWAWCCVKVTASWGGFEGTAYLGGVSILEDEKYPETKDPEKYFREHLGHFEDMKDEAIQELKKTSRENGWEIVETTSPFNAYGQMRTIQDGKLGPFPGKAK